MQRDLDALIDWGFAWGMKFKAKKSLDNEILKEVSDAKYLGIQIDIKLNWNYHISTVAAIGQPKLAFSRT